MNTKTQKPMNKNLKQSNQYPELRTHFNSPELSGALVPPQATDIEEAILGAFLIEFKNCLEIIDLLKPEHFYKEVHATIFKSIQNLQKARQPVDLLTVVQDLKKNDALEICGGAYFLSNLTNRIGSASHAETHARIIIEKYLRREIIKQASAIIKNAYDDTSDTFEVMENFSRASAKIEEFVSDGVNFQHIGKIIENESEAYLARSLASKKNDLIGVNTGFVELNKLTGGWQNPDLIILAARPAMGKTSLALEFALKASEKSKVNVGIFSLEMSDIQLVQRMIIAKSEVNSDQYKFGVLPHYAEDQVIETRKQMRLMGIYIDDTPSISIPVIRTKVRKMMRTNPLGLIIVDYLQLVTTGESSRKNREQEISYISSSLKAIAKEFKIPIIALAQLSRAVEQRGGDKRPQLSDLRESGAIEQDADMVMFLHRPEYYGITQDENGESTLGRADLIVAKHRNGATADVQIKFISSTTKFIDPFEGEKILTSDSSLMPNEEFLNNKEDWGDHPF